MIKIRRASVDDASIILEIRKRAFEDELNKYKLVPPDFDSIDMQIKKIQETYYYVILENDQIIGGACVSEESNKHYCLNSIYIDKHYQSKGYGSKFLDLLEKEFSDAESWCLKTPYLSFKNHYFYEKHGYKKIGEYIPEYSEDKSFKLFKYKKVVRNECILRKENEMLIETKRLILRELTMDDLKEMHNILSDPKSMKHYPKLFTLEESKNWIKWNIENYATYGFGLWGVVLKEENHFIGDCGITMKNINGKMEPEIGYHINKKYTNRGYATEAAQACKKYAFEVLRLKKVYSYMKYTNIASARVAEKNGMKLIMEIEDPKNTITKVYAITLEEYLTGGTL